MIPYEPPYCTPFDPSAKPPDIVGDDVHDGGMLPPNSSASVLSLVSMSLSLWMIAACSDSVDLEWFFLCFGFGVFQLFGFGV